MNLLTKCVIFCLPFLALLIVHDYIQEKYALEFKEGGSYFVGSSRVRHGINLERLKKSVRNDNLHNVAMSGSTFLHNIVLSEHLIKKHQAKELLIELAIIQSNYPDKHIRFGIGVTDYCETVFGNYISISDYFRLLNGGIVAEMEGLLFQKLNLQDAIKSVLNGYLNSQSLEDIGYVYSNKNHYKKLDSFIEIKDTNKNTACNILKYKHLITSLTQIAAEYKVKIRFFLPLTYLTEEERCIVSAIFKSLPNHLKIDYSTDFLHKIRNPSYLYNKNHFNHKGAEVMTDYFADFITD